MIKGETIENTVYEYEGGKIKSHTGNIEVKFKGSKPYSGTLLINNEGQIALAFYDNGNCAQKSYNSDEIKVEKKTQEECIITEEVQETPVVGDISGANKPLLSSGMTPIKWDNENNEIETTEDDPEWYNYDLKKWANVKTADGSYWVWIPRYAYKITSGYHSSETGSIDVIFLKAKTTDNIKNIIIETTGYNAETKNTKW